MAGSGEQINVAIACGGTGGHLFPGLAVAERLTQHNVSVTLMVSPKEIDQLALRTAGGMSFVTLPAVGLTGLRLLPFLSGFLKSYRTASRVFHDRPPRAALAMGGFTSAPPVLAARRFGAATFLHESNSVPGRANRWLSRAVDRAFIGFPDAAKRLHCRDVSVTGTPVRPKFQLSDPAVCRRSLGLNPDRPVVLVMGGSQGAHAVNELVLASLPLLSREGPDWQWIHLSGAADAAKVKAAYQSAGLNALVHPFLAEMELAMGAATVSLSRAGASSLAELAAMRLPAILVPFPAATDNHQFYNASVFEQTGAARLLEQRSATPDVFGKILLDLMRHDIQRDKMRLALDQWHSPRAAAEIAQAILEAIGSQAKPLQAHARPLPGDQSDQARSIFISASRAQRARERGLA
jgi:UDP-N-acetylglucosamine--N-acetylmuramyl-(pentapeptide) pyrophosphoryl-undecaprenol N-acetylglucosamine transferase